METQEPTRIITDLPNRTPTERMLDVSQIPSMSKDNHQSVVYPGFNSSAEVSRLRETLIEISKLQQEDIAKAFRSYDEGLTNYFTGIHATLTKTQDRLAALEVVLQAFMEWVMLSEKYEPEQLKKLQDVMTAFLKRNNPPPESGTVFFDTNVPGSIGG